MIGVAPSTPWCPETARLAVRGRLSVTLRAGEAPEHLPPHDDVRRGLVAAPMRVDGGPVDRLLRRWSPAFLVSRVFTPARRFGHRPAWSDLEQQTGVARRVRIELDPDAPLLALLADLRELDAVESASPQYLCVTPFASGGAVPAADAFGRIRADEALALEPGDPTLVVGVVDSGCDLAHPELQGVLRPGLDTVDLPRERVSRGLTLYGDTARRDRIPQDEMGHGTAVATLIAGRGVHAHRGVGGACRVLPMRALAGARMAGSDRATAIGTLDDLDEALKAAVDLGARLLNLSFGTPASALREDDPPPHREAVAYAAGHGCLMVAASGNAGTTDPYYPACLPEVLAVGSVDTDGRPSRFTSRGPHVLVCAPGEAVHTATLEGYGPQTGTSFAAPLVTGALALLTARAARHSEPVTLAMARSWLAATSRPFPPGSSAQGCGAGILDVAAALRRVDADLADTDTVHPAPASLHA